LQESRTNAFPRADPTCRVHDEGHQFQGFAEDLLQLAAGRKLPGKVAVKLHSGEPGGHHFPNPTLIGDLVKSVNGTIVECNTA
jgi:hypothetical protein